MDTSPLTCPPKNSKAKPPESEMKQIIKAWSLPPSWLFVLLSTTCASMLWQRRLWLSAVAISPVDCHCVQLPPGRAQWKWENLAFASLFVRGPFQIWGLSAPFFAPPYPPWCHTGPVRQYHSV